LDQQTLKHESDRHHKRHDSMFHCHSFVISLPAR
jgi:hypothetical protein